MLHYDKYLSSLINKKEKFARVMACKLQLEVKISFTARTDRNMSHYCSGRDLPPYLHS